MREMDAVLNELQDKIRVNIPEGSVRLVDGEGGVRSVDDAPGLGKDHRLRLAGTVRYQDGEATEYAWPATLGDHMRRSFAPKRLRRRLGVRMRVLRIEPRRVYRDGSAWSSKVTPFVYMPVAAAAAAEYDAGPATEDRRYAVRREIVIKKDTVATFTQVGSVLDGLCGHSKALNTALRSQADRDLAVVADKAFDGVANYLAERWRSAVFVQSERIERSYPATWWDALKERYGWLGAPRMITVVYDTGHAAQSCGLAVAVSHVYQWEVTESERIDRC